ncbi:hypothetical protein WDU94_015224 [Cyamophila willieti]
MHLLNLLHNNMVVDLLFNRMIVLDSTPKHCSSEEFSMQKIMALNVVLSLILNILIISYIAYRMYVSYLGKPDGTSLNQPDSVIDNLMVPVTPTPLNNNSIRSQRKTPRTKSKSSPMGDSKEYPEKTSKNVSITQFYNPKEMSLLKLSSDSSDILSPARLSNVKASPGQTKEKKAMQEQVLRDMNVSPSMQNIFLQNKKSSKQNRRNIL